MADAHAEPRRMMKLREVMGKALDCAVESISSDDLWDCFPSVVEANGEFLDDLCGQALQKIKANVLVSQLVILQLDLCTFNKMNGKRICSMSLKECVRNLTWRIS